MSLLFFYEMTQVIWNNADMYIKNHAVQSSGN
jgi:hypothetical protein